MDSIVRRSAMPVPVDTLWAWHTRPGALERLLPPWDGARVVSRTGGIANGTRVTLSVPFGPARLGWVSEHRDVNPPHGFVDTQISGPFAHWVHHHDMRADGPAASILEDRVEFAGPAGPIGRAIARRAVASRLAPLFRYRHETLAADLAAHARVADRPRLTVGITGASGLVGTALTHFLTSGGHRVIRFVRSRPGSDHSRDTPDSVTWDPQNGFPAPDRVPALDAVVHLAGAGVADRRWTPQRMALIRDSRVQGTGTLARALAALPNPPRTLLCASAIGFYGFDGRTPVDETAPMGGGFLAAVCGKWEAAAEPARAAGLRVAHLRLGLVLTPAGGMLKPLYAVFRAGAGGVIASGTQGMSWVGLDDVVGAFHHALFDDTLRGPINVTAPEPASNAVFTAALGRAAHRPTLLPVPAAALRLLLGRQMADETALASGWITPARLEAAGYPFRHRRLDDALAHYLP
ncbi:MAG: TIGR01777 family oxidoreductase [Vicinamibacteraceae bacterium]